MQDFKKLRVWQKGHALTLAVYSLTAHFPTEEKYGLARQLRKAAASVPSNLAEGCGRTERGDFRRFVDHAAGSSKEVEYQLLLSHDLGYLDTKRYKALSRRLDDLQRMLRGLRAKLT